MTETLIMDFSSFVEHLVNDISYWDVSCVSFQVSCHHYGRL